MTQAVGRQNTFQQQYFGEMAQAAVVVTAASFLAGALTAWAQTVLPYELFFLSNSASGWILVMVALLWGVREHPLIAALLGSVSGIMLMLGFTAALAVLYSERYNPWLWTLSGAAAGPFIGIATAWLRERGIRAALGTAALAGVAIGDAGYGLTAVRESTSPVYWTLSAAVGFGLLSYMATRRIDGRWSVALAIIATAAVAGVFLPIYATVGSMA